MSKISILALLLASVMQSAFGDELFSVDVERIKQTAIDAALEKYPNLLPGDLDNESMAVHISCYEPSECQADMTFKILSSVVEEEIQREGDTCSQTTKSKNVRVTIDSDGSVSRISDTSFGSSTRTVECPASIAGDEEPLN